MTGDALSDNPDDIANYRISSPVIDSVVMPTHIARPSNIDELQKLLRLANEVGMNLTVASSTGAHSKGGFAAAKENVLVDLSSWKQIPWVNRRNRVCLIEPGVTYSELIQALEPQGMTIPMPLSPRDGKSVIASVMDREPTTWPNRQWDISDPVASTEFIFGNGELFRTGAAGGPGTLEQQRAAGGAQKSSAGPSQSDFHRVVQGAQGTMGVVTWITIRTELRPVIEKPFLLGANSLQGLIPFVYEVQRPWLGEHSFILDRNAAAMLIDASGSDTFESIRGSLPRYICLQNIAGFERMPEKRVQYQQKDIESIADRHGLKMTMSLGTIAAKTLLEIATRPCGEADWRHHLRGHCLSIFFLTTLDRAPELIDIYMQLIKQHGIEEELVGCYVQPIVQNHACHVELMYPFDPGVLSEIELVRNLEKEAVLRLTEGGAFFSRPYGSASEVVFKQNPLNYELLRKVKGIFDPNRVLNDGKWEL
ncbi:MAG: FAD-binding oxidoreductase [Dehalococcoidia bacterium]|nr:MAG: FAD-binding oxidoreductase [Dehalococcoidia bacterium]